MKLRLTAFNISSIDMNTVITLRRNRNPAMPSVNNTALRIRYQESGTPADMLLHLLLRQHHRAQNSDQDQHRNHFEGQQILGEERAPYVERGAVLEPAEAHVARSWKHVLREVRHQPEERKQQRNPQHLRQQRAAFAYLRAGIQQHDHEDEQDHDGAGVYYHLRGRQELRAQQQVQYGQRSHHSDQRDGA